MGIINIHEANREGARVVIGIAGASGSGKTHTAILVAMGLANNDSKKIGFLDTENRRGSLYADLLKNEDGEVQRFSIGDLIPPFSPDRYTQAIREFESTGIEVLIIDTITHEWEGTGGCAEIAEAVIGGNPKRTALGWARAKTAHKKLINTLLQCDMHIICCIRAREQTSFKDPNKPVSLGVQPIQEKNFMFEMTASLLMHDEGKSQTPLKCPADLRNIFGRGNDYITAADGLKLREWVDGGSQLDRDVERYKNRLLGVAEQGLIYTKKCWDQTPEEIRNAFEPGFQTQLYGSAEAYDTLKKSAETEPGKPSLKGAFLPSETKEAPTHLQTTSEWAKWIEAEKNCPDIAKTLPVPTTTDECLERVKKIGELVDMEAA